MQNQLPTINANEIYGTYDVSMRYSTQMGANP